MKKIRRKIIKDRVVERTYICKKCGNEINDIILESYLNELKKKKLDKICLACR
jgi:hypothetical protein